MFFVKESVKFSAFFTDRFVHFVYKTQFRFPSSFFHGTIFKKEVVLCIFPKFVPWKRPGWYCES